MNEQLFDVIIIGGGPAGLTAGLYTSRAKLNSLLIENMLVGGQVMTTTKVENYPGFPGGIDGPELVARFHEHCQEFGLQIVNGEARQLRDEGSFKVVTVDDKEFKARAVIVTTGAEPRKLGIPGEQKLIGRGVSYCATCDGAFFRDVPVAVIGGGDTAAEEALFLTRFASKVYIIHRRDQLRATKTLQDRIFANDKIEVLWNALPEEVLGDQKGVNGLRIADKFSGEKRLLALEGVFFAIGVIPKARFLAEVLELNSEGYILTDAECRTSMPGVFAAGDVRSKLLKQIATAVGDGAVAAIAIEKYLDEL